MLANINKSSQDRMQKALESFKNELGKLRTGRAHPSLLEHVKANCYGSDMPLNQLANITIKDSRALAVTPWDKNLTSAIEKAIMQADLGLNPITSGAVILVPLPVLTEERRRDLVKVVKTEAENAKVALRNIRRDSNDTIKKMLKDKEITEDEERKGQEQIQKMIDNFVAEVDKMVVVKEKDLLEI